MRKSVPFIIALAISLLMYANIENGQSRFKAAIFSLAILIPSGFLASVRSRIVALLPMSRIVSTISVLGSITILTMIILSLGGSLGFGGMIFAWVIIWIITEMIINWGIKKLN